MVSIITQGVSRQTSSCFSPLPNHNISRSVQRIKVNFRIYKFEVEVLKEKCRRVEQTLGRKDNEIVVSLLHDCVVVVVAAAAVVVVVVAVVAVAVVVL